MSYERGSGGNSAAGGYAGGGPQGSFGNQNGKFNFIILHHYST